MTTTRTSPCINGCVTRTASGDQWPTRADAPSLICTGCEDNLKTWLRDIPDHYALLPEVIEPGSIERNPEAKGGGSVEAPAPLRLDIVDLMDERIGRMWNGLAPAGDRRGVIGTLLVYAERVTEERGVTQPAVTVSTLCTFLARHRLWIGEQDWAPLMLDEVKRVHRGLSDAIGEFRRPPVGICPVTTEDGDCKGKLYPSSYAGVRCAKCGATWDTNQLRLLGRALAESTETAQ